jgi:DNA-binding XRE family transcriptional regulator
MVNTFSKKFVEFRKKMNFTQKELAAILGVSQECICAWEIGSKTPGKDALFKIVKYAEKKGFIFTIEDILSKPLPKKSKKNNLEQENFREELIMKEKEEIKNIEE